MRTCGVLLLACVNAAGCSGLQAPETVRVPVSVPCVAGEIEKPDLVPDAVLAAMDDYTLIVELALDRRQRQQYEARLEAALAGCRGV